jgi:TnpA family transposase
MRKDKDAAQSKGRARPRVNANLIRENWDDILCLAGSLKLGVVQAMSVCLRLKEN